MLGSKLIQVGERGQWSLEHYDDVIMTILASQITSLTVVYSIVYSGVNQRKHQSSASLAFVREIHRGPVNFPHKWPVTRKMFHLMTSSWAARWVTLFFTAELTRPRSNMRAIGRLLRTVSRVQILIRVRRMFTRLGWRGNQPFVKWFSVDEPFMCDGKASVQPDGKKHQLKHLRWGRHLPNDIIKCIFLHEKL